MRLRVAAWSLSVACGLGCKGDPGSAEPVPSVVASATLPPELLQPRRVRPISSEAIEAARQVQARKLQLVPPRVREPRLAFGRGVLGQLTDSELRVFDATDFELLVSQPLAGPRTLLALADGSLLALGSTELVRLDPSNKKVTRLGRPMLLPGAELYADAVVADRIWVFDPGSAAGSAQPAKLSSMLLTPGSTGLLLPDREAELELGPGGVLGTTREGVWVYVANQAAERLGPGGARLSKLRLTPPEDLLWMLPARRLDQCYLVERDGGIARAVVSPTFKQLSGTRLAGAPWSVLVGDEGRLVAAVVVTGEGPRFELQLLDADLTPSGRAQLPSEPPTGGEDWIKVVTRNQGLAVAAREARVAVGGPDRVLVFDGQGNRLFSIPSR